MAPENHESPPVGGEREDLQTTALFRALVEPNDAYTDDAWAVVRFLRERRHGFSLEGLAAYYGALLARYGRGEITASTVNKRLAGMKARIRQVFARQGGDYPGVDRRRLEEALESFVTVRIRRPPIHPESVPTDEEIVLLGMEGTNALVRVLVPFLAETGLRISEALKIRKADIVKTPRGYRVTVRGRGSACRVVIVPSWLMDRVETAFSGTTYLFEHGGKPYSRIPVTDRIRAESRRILGREYSAQTFRHCYALRLLREGKSLDAVSEALGHRSMQTAAESYRQDIPSEGSDLSDRKAHDGREGGNG